MFRRPEHHAISIRQQDVSDARFKRFMREFDAYEQQVAFQDTLDTFLDLYSAWMKMHEPWMKVRLVMLAFEPNRLNPRFECTLAFQEEHA